uniref:Uncharacterized protein n=1 Tax=Phytophthora ramorum TaxID=164328 RepID=H3GW16_PHYRM
MFTEANESFQGLSPLASSSPDTLPPSPTPTSAKPKKKRKATYILRKEEQSTLQQEIERLESQVAVLKTRNLPPEEAAKADPVLQRREAENAALTSVLRHQQLHVANAQSLLSRCLGDQGVESLEQVYNALIFYLTNMEISISERLGHITVRDDYDSIDGTAYNSRIASTEDCGVTTEMNAVSFPQLFGEGELGPGVGPCAILASDCVDEDELYPYTPSERVRKDVSGAVVLTVSRQKPKHKGGVEETELVVTMRRAAFVKLHKPQFPVSPFALQELHEGIARWGDVMLKTVRSVVYTTA